MIISVEVQAVEPLADGTPFGETGAYERVIGVARGEVDPGAAGNKGIALIDKAPRNARGMVEYTTDFFVLRPKDPAKGETVEFTGDAKNHKGKPRRVTGRAQPANDHAGKIKVRIHVDDVELIFNGTYELGR